MMPDLSSFDYALIRVVPHVEREEFVNVGVILFCRTWPFLAAKIEVNRERLLALDPDLDMEAVERHLASIPRICSGDPNAGPIAQLPMSGRFHWLISPRSTVIQTSHVHTGVSRDPHDALDKLFARVVQTRAEPSGEIGNREAGRSE